MEALKVPQNWRERRGVVPVRIKPVGYKCVHCTDLGWVYVTDNPLHPEFGKAHRCRMCGVMQDDITRKQRNRERLEQIDGLEPMERRIRISELVDNGGEWRRAVEALTASVSRHRGIVTLTGAIGSGKTTLMIGTVNMARVAGIAACYRTAVGLFDELRACYDYSDGQRFTDLWELVSEAKVLCLDDVDKWNPTPWASERIDALLDHRYRQRSDTMTVVGGNTVAGLDPHIVSRITTHEAQTFKLSGLDMRKEAA